MDKLIKQRVSLSTFFFLSGLCFSSWAARIPTIKANFDFNEAELGSVLFAMPISSLMGLPLSGWLVEKFESRWPLFWSFIAHAFFLVLIALSPSVFTFTAAIFMFALSNRILNIAINTQAINLQNIYPKKINGSFHGLWSLGGIAGVGITTIMISLKVGMLMHFVVIGLLTLGFTFWAFRDLMSEDKTNASSRLMLKKPDPLIMNLGLLILCAAIVEGGMFDWSGIYFKEVVKVEIFTTGYLMFMTSMAISRFFSDWFIQRYGMPRMYLISSALIVFGLLMSVLLPFFWTAMIGFMIVGMGTASIVPMSFLLAGASKHHSPGIAISLIATFGLVGFMVGPPLIGYIAHAFDLRASFVFVALTGLMIIPGSINYFRKKDSVESAAAEQLQPSTAK
jgi:MFS family permease